jgi:anti-anti-sigma factor
MTVQLTRRRGVPIAHIRGEIDSANAPGLANVLFAAVPNGAPGLVIDLSNATLLDSVGMRLLFETVERLHRRGQRLRVVVPSESVIEDVVTATDLASYAGVDVELGRAVDLLGAGHK